jgi:histidinol-phosphatase
MSIDARELQEALDFATQIAREAGEITLKYFRSSLAVETKHDGSEVTIADRETEAHLRRRISEQFPEDGILGEEEKEQVGASGRRWIIDPIDGTYSFVHGVPMFGVLVALVVDDDPVVGVVNLPATQELVCAARGFGCFANGKAARVSATTSLSEALVLATDFGTCERNGFGPAAERIQRQARARRTWGDCYGYILVATGRADVMLDPVMNVWDCAPLLPILEEAGGSFTDWHGQRTIAGGNAIATNGKLFAEVMRLVNDER